ncbi:type II toxin-antitoxin system YoeB family toxin [Cuspidothrix issatschenkoi]|nr:type II toxin-antitoxin system YoeB family toxin [Cuspidothrix issatschenkoi]
MKKVAFEPEAFEELGQWGTEDKKVFKKILSLIKVLIIIACKYHYD